MEASLGGGDGVEDGGVYLVHVLLAVQGGELPDDALRARDRLSVWGENTLRNSSGHEPLPPSARELRPKCEKGAAAAVARYKQRGEALRGGSSQWDSQIKGPSVFCFFCFVFFHTAIIHLSAECRDIIGNPGV